MKYVFSLFMMIALISFLGFTVENLWTAATKGYMDSKNMVLPFLLGYGLAVTAIFLLFGLPREMRFAAIKLTFESDAASILCYFAVIMLCICVGEIALGYAVEKTCGIIWWDYSDIPLHITKYTSIPTSAGFTVMIVFFMDKVFTPLFAFFSRQNTVVLGTVSVSLMVLMVVDFIRSAYLMRKNRVLRHTWRRETVNNRVYKALHKNSSPNEQS